MRKMEIESWQFERMLYKQWNIVDFCCFIYRILKSSKKNNRIKVNKYMYHILRNQSIDRSSRAPPT